MITSWIATTRPRTLLIGFSPVLMGLALALSEGHFSPFIALATLITGLSIQMGANVANDFFDEADRRRSDLKTCELKCGLFLIFGVSTLFALPLILIGGWPFFALLVSSILLAIFYTASSFNLSNLGIADLATLLFFGPIATCATYYLQTRTFSMPSVILGFSPGLFSVAILNINNLRDVDTDAKLGRKTLTVRFGKNFSKRLYMLALAIALCLPAALLQNRTLFLLPLTLLATPLIKSVFQETDLTPVLGKTALLELIFALGFTLCLLI